MLEQNPVEIFDNIPSPYFAWVDPGEYFFAWVARFYPLFRERLLDYLLWLTPIVRVGNHARVHEL